MSAPVAPEMSRQGVTLIFAPPCERSFSIHYRDDEPYGLLIDGRAYRVMPLKGRGTAVRSGDCLYQVVERLR